MLPDAQPGEVAEKVREELERENEGVEIQKLVRQRQQIQIERAGGSKYLLLARYGRGRLRTNCSKIFNSRRVHFVHWR